MRSWVKGPKHMAKVVGLGHIKVLILGPKHNFFKEKREREEGKKILKLSPSLPLSRHGPDSSVRSTPSQPSIQGSSLFSVYPRFLFLIPD